VKKSVLPLPSTIQEPRYPYQNLTDCFQSHSDLKKFNLENVLPVAERFTSQAISDLATNHSFTLLAQPTVESHGKTISNDLYMRPDLLYANQNQNTLYRGNASMDPLPQVFTQALACNGYAQASKSDQPKLFESALNDTKAFDIAYGVTLSSSCGRECSFLVSDSLSKNSQENFADWLAIQTLPKRLARESSQEKRRKISELGMPVVCTAPGPVSNAPTLAAVEKQYSYETHPDDRIRRLSIFTPAVAKFVGCDRDADTKKGFGSCAP
jgi:hypothetical protein